MLQDSILTAAVIQKVQIFKCPWNDNQSPANGIRANFRYVTYIRLNMPPRADYKIAVYKLERWVGKWTTV
jgi:hypothetical protein